MPITAKQIRSNEQLLQAGLNADEVKEFRRTEQRYYEMLVELDDANEKKDYERVNLLEYQTSRTEFRLRYQGVNPKEIPLDVLKSHFAEYESDDLYVQSYRRKISNPATAVRSFCVSCMSGQIAEVRMCQATMCTLWPVRMGKNPFFGKVMPPTEDLSRIELDDDADAALVEDDDNVEAKE